jgi:uncharacterized protein YndB with AHSA1/START domain
LVPNQIERDIFINAPIERVWSVLTEAEHIGRGNPGVEAEVELHPGGAIRLLWADFGTMLFRVERVEPPHFFSFRWARPLDAEPVPGNSTLVEFTLTPEGTGTRLRVVESGIRSLDQPDPAKIAYFDDNTQGWIGQLDEIRTYAESLAG